MMAAVITSTLGADLQTGAQNPSYFFGGRIIGGAGIGMFSMSSHYIKARSRLLNIEDHWFHFNNFQLPLVSITVAFWLYFGFSFTGGNKCNPEGIENLYLPDGTYNAAAKPRTPHTSALINLKSHGEHRYHYC